MLGDVGRPPLEPLVGQLAGLVRHVATASDQLQLQLVAQQLVGGVVVVVQRRPDRLLKIKKLFKKNKIC